MCSTFIAHKLAKRLQYNNYTLRNGYIQVPDSSIHTPPNKYESNYVFTLLRNGSIMPGPYFPGPHLLDGEAFGYTPSDGNTKDSVNISGTWEMCWDSKDKNFRFLQNEQMSGQWLWTFCVRNDTGNYISYPLVSRPDASVKGEVSGPVGSDTSSLKWDDNSVYCERAVFVVIDPVPGPMLADKLHELGQNNMDSVPGPYDSEPDASCVNSFNESLLIQAAVVKSANMYEFASWGFIPGTTLVFSDPSDKDTFFDFYRARSVLKDGQLVDQNGTDAWHLLNDKTIQPFNQPIDGDIFSKNGWQACEVKDGSGNAHPEMLQMYLQDTDTFVACGFMGDADTNCKSKSRYLGVWQDLEESSQSLKPGNIDDFKLGDGCHFVYLFAQRPQFPGKDPIQQPINPFAYDTPEQNCRFDKREGNVAPWSKQKRSVTPTVPRMTTKPSVSGGLFASATAPGRPDQEWNCKSSYLDSSGKPKPFHFSMVSHELPTLFAEYNIKAVDQADPNTVS